MGAVDFYQISKGTDALEAFTNAIKEARYRHGHEGYTGTIAEKPSFTMATENSLSLDKAFVLAESVIDTKYSDKWGPSACIELLPSTPQSSETKEFLFFGWASS